MSITFALAGDDGASVRLRVSGYERPEIADGSDADWLAAHVDVAVDHFSATIDGSLRTEDFYGLRGQLSSILLQGAGLAEFGTLEDILRLSVNLENTGRAMVTGYVRSLDKPKNQLSFAFASDRTFLERAAEDLDRVISAFPSRG